MTLTRKIGADIRADLLAGMSVKSIAKKYECSQATVSYHRGKVGLPKHPNQTKQYDWKAIDDAIKTRGLTWKQIELEFGPVHRSIQKAVIRGQIGKPTNGNAQSIPLSEVAV
jgi:hypothetical protein